MILGDEVQEWPELREFIDDVDENMIAEYPIRAIELPAPESRAVVTDGTGHWSAGTETTCCIDVYALPSFKRLLARLRIPWELRTQSLHINIEPDTIARAKHTYDLQDAGADVAPDHVV